MSGIVERLRAIDGARLRIVLTMGAIDYEVGYVREDLTDRYDSDDFDEAYEAMLANRVSSDDFSRIGEFGGLDTQIFLFDEIVVFLFPAARYEAVFASFDRTESFPFLAVATAGEGDLDEA